MLGHMLGGDSVPNLHVADIWRVSTDSGIHYESTSEVESLAIVTQDCDRNRGR